MPLINRVAQAVAGEGVILRGAGAGLRFDARGCNPGFLAGTSEPLEQQLLLKYCKTGHVVYDIGANAGFYVVIAARAVGPQGHVYAFEPSPSLVSRIAHNVALNKLDNVQVVDAAVTSVDGNVSFGIVGPLSVSNAISAAASANSIPVRALRLDTFGQDHRQPDLLLIDVEGAEIEVLEGALEMIARRLPVIMVEVHWLGQSFLDFVQRKLKPLGYVATTYAGAAMPAEVERYHAILVPHMSEPLPEPTSTRLSQPRV
jgi:FkbM family methyltransferase